MKFDWKAESSNASGAYYSTNYKGFGIEAHRGNMRPERARWTTVLFRRKESECLAIVRRAKTRNAGAMALLVAIGKVEV